MLKGQSALALDEALEAAVLRALREAPGGPQGLSAIHGQGPVAQFEDAFRSLLGVPFVLAVSSGTAALHTALMACGVGPEDEVILSTYDWPAGTAAVLHQHARPVFADIDPDTYTLDPASAARRITPRTKALLVTHIFGHPADMEGLNALAEQHGLRVIEDCAQSLGATYRGVYTGLLGDIGCFSLGPGKIVSAGEGGAVVTRDEGLYVEALRHSQHPLRQSLEVPEPNLWALNYRMHPLAAALALAQLPDLQRRLAERRAAAKRLEAALEGLPGVRPPVVAPGCEHAYHRYSPTFVPGEANGCSRERLVQLLTEATGVPACPGYIRVPLHLEWDGPSGGGLCPVAERRCRELELGLDLPPVP